MLVGARAHTLGGRFTLLQNLLYSGAFASKPFPHHAAYVQCREVHYTSYIHDDTRCSNWILMRIIFRLLIHTKLAGKQLVNGRMLPNKKENKKKEKRKKKEQLRCHLTAILSIPSSTDRCNIWETEAFLWREISSVYKTSPGLADFSNSTFLGLLHKAHQ